MPKRKRYNPFKQASVLAKQQLKHLVLGCVPGQSQVFLIDKRSGNTQPFSKSTFNMLSRIRHPWSVFIAVFGRDHTDQIYMKAKEINVVDPTYQADLVDTLNVEHRQLIKEFNPAHFQSVGWLASPYRVDWDEAHAFSMLEKIGVLDITLSLETEV